MKQLLFIALLASFGGCSNFTINGTICNQIQTEPNTQNIPQECKQYDKKAAQKAFDGKNKSQEKEDMDDVIEFQKTKEQK